MNRVQWTMIGVIQFLMILSAQGQGQIQIDSVTGVIVQDAIRIEYAQDDGVQVSAAGGDGIFVNLADRYGVFAFGKKGNYFRGSKGPGEADLILGGTFNGQSSGDDGVITSDPTIFTSDLIMEANDAVIARIDKNNNGQGNFFVWDDNATTLFQVSQAGDVTVRNKITLDPISGDDAIITSNPDDVGGDLFLESNDAVVVKIDKNNNGNGNFLIPNPEGGLGLFQVTRDGDVYVNGTLRHSSDRNRKEKIEDVACGQILEALVNTPVYKWQYKGHEERHIGPMAQDFFKAFDVGNDDKTIAAIDADGVALAAIKAQHKIIEEQRLAIDTLQNKVSELDQLREEINELKELVLQQK
ncbi:MAG: tail fiber domain-containing protein [Saprospiraceae bacterium]|nr:tail fiber domain-containing protein [Saprospiraceae bacterium]